MAIVSTILNLKIKSMKKSVGFVLQSMYKNMEKTGTVLKDIYV